MLQIRAIRVTRRARQGQIGCQGAGAFVHIGRSVPGTMLAGILSRSDDRSACKGRKEAESAQHGQREGWNEPRPGTSTLFMRVPGGHPCLADARGSAHCCIPYCPRELVWVADLAAWSGIYRRTQQSVSSLQAISSAHSDDCGVSRRSMRVWILGMEDGEHSRSHSSCVGL